MREYFLHESSLAFTSHVLRFSVNSLHDVPARSAPISAHRDDIARTHSVAERDHTAMSGQEMRCEVARKKSMLWHLAWFPLVFFYFLAKIGIQ